MAKFTVVTMPGDGIGKQVLPEALRLLKAVGFDANYVHGDIGWECWSRHGNALPDNTIELLAKHKLALVGAITKPKEAVELELRPELKANGHSHFDPRYLDPLVTLRQRLHLDTCVRPCSSFPGNPLNFTRRGAGSEFEELAVNVVVIWPNTVVVQRFWLAVFEWAKRYGYKSVTICQEPNVPRAIPGVLDQADAIAKEYPEIALRSVTIEATTWPPSNPEDFGVVVASDGVGDLVADTFTGLSGGLGFAASGYLSDDCAVFMPAHGSASQYAELDPPIVNPIAIFLSAVMLLNHIGETVKAKRIRDAIAAVVKEGKVRTFDMMRIAGGDKAISEGAASTYEMTDAILAKLIQESSPLPPEYAATRDRSPS